uniref:Uncharacterized protein n=1 Tax=Plectus sambesii TaxID=2011161 RepID=A0A914XKS2_9BILA
MAQPSPIVSIAVNGDGILSELKDLLKDVQVSISRLAATAELNMNQTFGSINRQVLSVSDDIKTITSNVSTSSAGLPDPWLIILMKAITIVVLCLLIVFLLLATRRELKRYPIRARRKRSRNVYETVNGQLLIPEDVCVESSTRPSSKLRIITDV